MFSTSRNLLDLVPIVATPPFSFGFDRPKTWRLPGAHGEEVVRCVYLDEQVSRKGRVLFGLCAGSGLRK